MLSFGIEAEISAALEHIGVDGMFDGVYGNAAWDRLGLTGNPAEAKQHMLTVWQAEIAASTIVSARCACG